MTIILCDRFLCPLTNGRINPGGTLPLKWKYSSPGQKVWTNESSIKGVSYAPAVTYNSSIYYIVYKHKSPPGIQPTSMDFKSEQA